MASSSSRSSTSYHIRSTSFPITLRPTNLRVEADLNKLQTWETSATPTAETICKGLSSLDDLYKSMDDLLRLSSAQQALSHDQHEKWVNELLDGSIRLLDICGSARELVSQIKENVRDLQSALRKRKGNLSIESSIAKYISFRKKTKKDAKRLIALLKQMENQIAGLSPVDVDHRISVVIKVPREVNAVSISIFQSLLLFLYVPVSKPNTSRWSLFLKLIHKEAVSCEDQLANERALEGSIEGIENGLEGVFRRLISTRASVLNIISS